MPFEPPKFFLLRRFYVVPGIELPQFGPRPPKSTQLDETCPPRALFYKTGQCFDSYGPKLSTTIFDQFWHQCSGPYMWKQEFWQAWSITVPGPKGAFSLHPQCKRSASKNHPNLGL